MNKINIYSPKTCIWLGLCVNIFLTIFKLFAGILGNSYAMVADGLHSFSDILSTIIAYIGIHISAKPADKEHPYGHGNAETIAAFLVALIILATAIYTAVSSGMAIIRKHPHIPSMIALFAAVISIIVKETLYRYTIKTGNRCNSPALISDAWHHRSDAYSSIASLFGIGGAKLFSWYLDPIAGIVVAFLILQISLKLIRSNIGILMDEKPNPVILNNIKTVVDEIKEVKKIDNIKVHPRGSTFTIDIEIAVDSQITVSEGHRIAAIVRKKLLKQVPYIGEVMVHVNPYENRSPNKKVQKL